MNVYDKAELERIKKVNESNDRMEEFLSTQREELDNLKEKKLIKSGFFYFDYLKDKIEESQNDNEILVAPSWNKNRLNFINEDFEEILKNLLNAGYKVRFRPHPENFKRSKHILNFFEKKFKSEDFILDDSPGNKESMERAKCLITDNSGIAIEYTLLFKKPVLYFDNSFFKNFHPHIIDSLLAIAKLLEYLIISNEGSSPSIPEIAFIVKYDLLF